MPREKYILYQRTGSPNWYVRFSIKGHGQIRKCLETEDRTEADRRAYRLWCEAVDRNKQGLQVREKRFADVAEEYIDHIDVLVGRGKKKEHMRTLDIPTIKRYFIPFFGNKIIDRIRVKDIGDYTEWRTSYWVSGPGSNIEFITYKRAGRQIKSPVNRHEIASPSRLKREATMLRQVFNFAVSRGYITVAPHIESIEAEDNPRASFTADEMKKIRTLALKRATQPGINEHLRHERGILFSYINLLAYSGMRVADINDMTWRDVRGYIPPQERLMIQPGEAEKPVADIFGNEADEPQHVEHSKKNEIELCVRAKEHAREFIPHPHAAISFDFLYKAWEHWMKRPPEPDDPLFFSNTGKRQKSFAKPLRALLVEAGLEKDYKGHRRTAGSFRHFYISQMIVNGTDAYLLAKNAGTSVDMIKRFYDAADIKKNADQLRAAWKKST